MGSWGPPPRRDQKLLSQEEFDKHPAVEKFKQEFPAVEKKAMVNYKPATAKDVLRQLIAAGLVKQRVAPVGNTGSSKPYLSKIGEALIEEAAEASEAVALASVQIAGLFVESEG